MVSDDVVRELLEERLRRKDSKRGFVIDGYPRNIPQAQSLDNLLGMLGRPLQIAIYTEMSDDLLNKRNVGRQTCTGCGEIYNKYFSPPTEADTCDKCGAPLGTRKDDTPKAVAARVAIHKEKTMPLITYFRAQHKLRTVAAAGSVDEIHHKICSIVDLEIRPVEIEAVFSAAESAGDADNTVIAGGQINRIPPAAEVPAVTRSKSQPAAKKSAVTPVKKKAVAKAATSVPAEKKTATRKTAAKKTVAKKSTAKKTTAKKSTAKKTAAKKVASKKTATKKPTAKKVARKAAAKKVAKKAVSKKVAKKAAVKKKAAAKKKVAKKVAAKKVPVKKKAAKKAATKNPAAKKKAVTKKKAAGKKKPAAKKK